MRYWMMQLFLASRDEGTLLERLPPSQSREQYLRGIFSREIRFEYYRHPYVFKPFVFPEVEQLAAVIAKESTVTVAGPPEEAFTAHQISDWETANILLNPSPEIQQAAVQNAFGNPTAIFRKLIEHINDTNPSAPWVIAVNPVTIREQFWSAAERNRGHIAEIDLSFAVPNIWGGQSETEKALREFKEQNNAQEVEVKIKNRDGRLQPDSQRMRDAVDYVTRGGGTAQLRDESQATVYSSDTEENAVTTAVEPDVPIQEADIAAIRYLIKRLFGVG